MLCYEMLPKTQIKMQSLIAIFCIIIIDDRNNATNKVKLVIKTSLASNDHFASANKLPLVIFFLDKIFFLSTHFTLS